MATIKRYLQLALLLSLAGALLSPHTAVAGEIHQWRDKDGNVHFGDAPPTNVDSQQVEIRTNSYRALPVTGVSQRGTESPSEDLSGAPEVILYGTTWCGHCKKAKAYFRANNIAFTEYDVEKSARGKADFKRMGGGGVPIILVGGKRLQGFSKAKFAQAYASR